jgi:[glutamine synthetase] adenylyltransferase / [glutamine synthetase]-adenylyl-L-tyrosine phosphorylase
MHDLSLLRTALLDRFPEPWVRHHLDSFQGTYFEAFDEADVARHLGLMLTLSDERPVAVQARPAGDGEWWVDVVGYDCFQFLSTVCNLLAVRGLSIVEGGVFTSRPPPREQAQPARRVAAPGRIAHPPRTPRSPNLPWPDRRPKIVDVFRVRHEPPADDAVSPDWDHFQAELTALTRLLREGQSDEVHHRVIGRMVAALERRRLRDADLEPLDLTIDALGFDYATHVHIGAQDSFGFLYLTASALALCGIMIVQADIRTRNGRVDDSLWVTDRFGRKITAECKLRELRLSLILIEHFCSRLPSAANPEAALLHFSRFATDTMARANWAEEFQALDRPETLEALARVLGDSDFLWEDYLLTQPELLLPLICDPAHRRRRSHLELAAELEDALAAAPSHDARCRAIRRFRDREIFRTGIRAILRLSPSPEEFSAELTDLAEVLLQAAFRIAALELEPYAFRRSDAQVVRYALCALGKCGGRELGFASDLELMLVYDDRGIDEPTATRRTAEYFDRTVSVLRTALATRRDGTFELDFRLRPYGRGGSPATSLTAFLSYYRVGGSAWGYERQALIKLRSVAGDAKFGREVEAFRDRYVYGPEPFELAAYRRMRKLQVEQLVRPSTVNAKFSPGALVDVEYFVQALQIVYGSHDPSLRTPNTLQALEALGASGRLQTDQVECLRSSYRFLRALIDALRVVHGHAKDLTVPPPGSEAMVLLARRMRYPDSAQLQADLDERLQATKALVERLGELVGVEES